MVDLDLLRQTRELDGWDVEVVEEVHAVANELEALGVCAARLLGEMAPEN